MLWCAHPSGMWRRSSQTNTSVSDRRGYNPGFMNPSSQLDENSPVFAATVLKSRGCAALNVASLSAVSSYLLQIPQVEHTCTWKSSFLLLFNNCSLSQLSFSRFLVDRWDGKTACRKFLPGFQIWGGEHWFGALQRPVCLWWLVSYSTDLHLGMFSQQSYDQTEQVYGTQLTPYFLKYYLWSIWLVLTTSRACLSMKTLGQGRGLFSHCLRQPEWFLLLCEQELLESRHRGDDWAL